MSIFEKSTSYRPFKYGWAVEAEKQRRIDMHWHENQIELTDDIRQYNTKGGMATENVSHENNKKILDMLLLVFTEMDVNVGAGYTKLLPYIGNNEIRTLMLTNAAREITHARSYALAAESFGYTSSQWRGFVEYSQMMDKIELLSEKGYDDLSKPLHFAKYLTAILLGEGISLFGAFACMLNLKRHGIMTGFNVVNEWSLADESEHVSDNIRILNHIREEDLTEEENSDLDVFIRDHTIKLMEAEIRFLELVFAESDQEGMSLQDAKDYIRYLGLLRMGQLGLSFAQAENPLPWMDYVLSGSKHTNFFEQRVTDYSHTGLKGETDYSMFRDALVEKQLYVPEHEEKEEEQPKPVPQEERFIVLGRHGCAYCKRAVQLLEKKNKNFEYKNLAGDGNGAYLHLIRKLGCKTVPQIFVKNGTENDSHTPIGFPLGGYSELRTYLGIY